MLLAAAVLAGPARAALPSNCSPATLTVTCTYGYTGAEQTFAVPAGVTSVHVVAVGAAGGLGNLGAAGGAAPWSALT